MVKTTAIELERVTRVFGREQTAVTALDEVSIALPTGSFTAVMGPSGSGKSTFLNCAAGLDAVTSGDVRIGGRSIVGWNEAQLTRFRRRNIGFVFQGFNLIPYLTAEQNVGLPMRLARMRRDRTLVRDLLERVGMGERAGHVPAELSGGQQQRIALARALVTQPAAVFADEPTGALDTTSARTVLELLRSSVDDLDQTVVMVTHDPVAAAYADNVVFLVDGRITGQLANPTAEAVAAQMTHLGDLAGAR